MPAKISKFPREEEKDYYCVESPLRVLKTLGPIHHIVKYNSVSLYEGSMGIENPGLIIEDAGYYELAGKGLAVVGRIDGYEHNSEDKNPFIGDEKIISKLIKDYLIDVEKISPGSATYTGTNKIIHNYGKQNIINYLEQRTRKGGENPIKERALEDIINYGNVIFREDFCINDANMIAKKIILEIPKEFEPEFGYNANLRT